MLGTKKVPDLFFPCVKENVDLSLLQWFAALTPEQRLIELESRINFFLSLRSSNELQLSRDSRTSRQA